MKQLRPRDQRQGSHPGAANVSMMNRTEENMTAYQRNERNRRLISAMLLFTLVLSMFGNIGPALKGFDLGFVSTASACQPGKPCEDAPGQTKTETETIEVVPGTLVNNGGQVIQGNGNGVVTQALEGTNNATVTLIVQPDTVLNLPENTNATVIIAGATDADTASDLTSNTATNTATANSAVTQTTTTSGGNPHLVDPVLLEAFEATLNFGCGTGASHSNVGCWNHFTMTTLYQVKNNGTLKPVCRDTSNANNELVRDNGGWLVILSKFYIGVQNEEYELGPIYQCGGNPKGGTVK